MPNHVRELKPCPRGHYTKLQILTYKPRVSLIIKGKPNGTNRKERFTQSTTNCHHGKLGLFSRKHQARKPLLFFINLSHYYIIIRKSMNCIEWLCKHAHHQI
jgi:hypothetical protein